MIIYSEGSTVTITTSKWYYHYWQRPSLTTTPWTHLTPTRQGHKISLSSPQWALLGTGQWDGSVVSICMAHVTKNEFPYTLRHHLVSTGSVLRLSGQSDQCISVKRYSSLRRA